MKKILFLNTIQDKAWKNRALFLMLALVISMGNAWGTDYTSTMNVAGSPTGVGSVYVSDQSGATSGNQKLSIKSEGKHQPQTILITFMRMLVKGTISKNGRLLPILLSEITVKVLQLQK